MNSEGEGEWSTITVGTLQNEPPTLTAPSNAESGHGLQVPGRQARNPRSTTPSRAPAPEGATLTYVFRITLPGQTEPSPLASGLLSVTRSGNNFQIKSIAGDHAR